MNGHHGVLSTLEPVSHRDDVSTNGITLSTSITDHIRRAIYDCVYLVHRVAKAQDIETLERPFGHWGKKKESPADKGGLSIPGSQLTKKTKMERT